MTVTSIPTQRLRLQITPRVNARRVVQQCVDTITDAGGGADTFGARYLFASLSQEELATQLRAQLALTPDLALEAYVEPFVSIGRYTGLGDGGSITVRDGGATFAIDDSDFTAVSLRSTLVLRREIRPGSVLYAVWQQSRGRVDAVADPLFGVLGRPFTASGEHVVAVKRSWWFAP